MNSQRRVAPNKTRAGTSRAGRKDARAPARAQAQRRDAPENRGAWMAVLAVAAVTFLAYLRAFSNGFVGWDDPYYVTNNPLILDPTLASAIKLLRTVVSNNYHPLTMLTLWANAAAFGVRSAMPFIVTNVLLHAATTALVYLLVLRLTNGRRFAAAIVALLFGLHPMHVESVAWVSERKDVLYAVLFVGACITGLRYLDGGDRRWLLSTYALFLLSCLAKGMAVVFPVVLLLLGCWRGMPRRNVGAVLARIPPGWWVAFFGTSLLFGLIALDVQRGGDFHGLLVLQWRKPAIAREGPPLLLGLQLAAYGFWTYVLKLAWPLRLSAFYPYSSLDALEHDLQPVLWGAVVAAIALLGVLGWLARHRHRDAFFGTAWFLVTIGIVLQIVPVGEAAFADRYAYVSSIGLFLLVGLAADAAWRRRRGPDLLIVATSVVFVAFCATRTEAQIAVWHDSESLWAPTVRLYPDSPIPLRLRGQAIVDDQMTHRQHGEPVDTTALHNAIANLNASLALGPPRDKTFEALANAYGLENDLLREAAMLDRAIALDPANPEYYYWRGVAELKVDPVRAVEDFDASLRHGTTREPSEILYMRGQAYGHAHQYARARADFDRVIASGVADGNVYYFRGLARWQLGDPDAASDVREALRLNPTFRGAALLLQAIAKRQQAPASPRTTGAGGDAPR